MKSYNLKKIAESTPTITDKKLSEQRSEFNTSVEKQGTTEKNINLSLPVKNKDNTIPFNVQLDKARKNEDTSQIIESKMAKEETAFNEKKDYVKEIDKESQKYDNEKTKAYKVSKKDRDTSFWDKFVGVQMEEEKTSINKNVPSSGSQLQNHPDRINKKDYYKMVSSSVKDADAMLFHIYATAERDGRNLTKEEEQKVLDIQSGKERLFRENGDKNV